jgi:hypothetical protein
VTDPDQGREAQPDAAADEPGTATEAPSFGRHPVLVYTLQRLAVLLAVAAVLYLLGLRDVWLILFALLISGVISAFALKGSREGASYGITGAVTRVNQRIEDSARAEDADDYDDLGPTDRPPSS